MSWINTNFTTTANLTSAIFTPRPKLRRKLQPSILIRGSEICHSSGSGANSNTLRIGKRGEERTRTSSRTSRSRERREVNEMGVNVVLGIRLSPNSFQRVTLGNITLDSKVEHLKLEASRITNLPRHFLGKCRDALLTWWHDLTFRNYLLQLVYG